MYPNYDDSILNLMLSIKQGLETQSQTIPSINELLYPTSPHLDPADVRSAKKVVMIVVDGLGADFIKAKEGDSYIAAHFSAELSSVFPSTTASAITTFNTAVAPNQHAVVGWNLWLREIGQVSSILPFKPMLGNVNYRTMGIPLDTCVNAPSFYDKLSRTSTTFHPDNIADSDFNRFATRGAESLSYKTLNELFELAINKINAETEAGYYYLYWPYYDGICHQYGVNSVQADTHFDLIDNAVQQFIAQLKAHGDTMVLLTADHGMINTAPGCVINLNDYPLIQECLTVPLCGEPRIAYCYVAPKKQKQFEQQVQQQWADFCDLYHASEILAEQWYGRGENHPQLSQRIGDYILVMKDNHVVFEPLIKRQNSERKFDMIGVHGGLTQQEMLVPLCRWSL